MNADQYNKLNTLLSEFSLLSAALKSAEAEIETIQVAAAKDLLPKHAAAKVAITNLESDLRKLADAHYNELFPDEKKRTHNTPFGGVQYRKSSSLEVEDEEKAMLKIKLESPKEIERADCMAGPRLTAAQLIRTREELNLEALDQLDDATLSLFGIKRIRKDNFKVIPFTMESDKPAKKNGKKQEVA